MTRRTSSLLFIVLCMGLVGCDHATKLIAETELRGHGGTPLIANVLELRYTQNHDVGFSLLRQFPAHVRTPFIYLAGAVGVAFLIFMWSRRRNARWPEQLAYAVLLAGALGNLTDRMWRGYVVDFVYLHHWPVFNLADAYLVVGVGLLMIYGRSALEGQSLAVPKRQLGD